MGPARIPLMLDPGRCNRCGQCTEVCGNGALKVGASYIFVDWRSCDGCAKCADACARDAIRVRQAAVPRPAPERRSVEGKSTGWSLPEAGALLAVLVALFFAKDALMASEAFRGLDAEDTVLARAGVLFAFYALQAGMVWLLARRRGLVSLEALRLQANRVSGKAVLVSAALVIGLLVAVRVVGWAFGFTAQALGWDPPVREIANLTDVFGPTAWGLLLSVLLIVVVAPVVEEVVFRGVLQSAFVSRWGRLVGIGVGAGAFALYHFTPWMFVPLFALGVACGWLAETRRTLLPAISLHVAYNVIPVLITFYLVW